MKKKVDMNEEKNVLSYARPLTQSELISVNGGFKFPWSKDKSVDSREEDGGSAPANTTTVYTSTGNTTVEIQSDAVYVDGHEVRGKDSHRYGGGGTKPASETPKNDDTPAPTVAEPVPTPVVAEKADALDVNAVAPDNNPVLKADDYSDLVLDNTDKNDDNKYTVHGKTGLENKGTKNENTGAGGTATVNSSSITTNTPAQVSATTMEENTPRVRTESESKVDESEVADETQAAPIVKDTGSWGQVADDVKRRTMQAYAEDKEKDSSMNGTTGGDSNKFSQVGCKMTGTSKIASSAAGYDISIMDVNDKYDTNKDGLMTQAEIAAAIEANLLEGVELQTDYWENQLSKEKLSEISDSEYATTTFILARAEDVHGGQHWIVVEGYHTDENGTVVFDYNGTSNNDRANGRTYVLGTGDSTQNIYRVSKIETYTVIDKRSLGV